MYQYTGFNYLSSTRLILTFVTYNILTSVLIFKKINKNQ